MKLLVKDKKKLANLTNAKYILKPRELINLTSKMQIIEYENIYINNISNHSL